MGDAGRRLKFLRSRENVTIGQVATATGLDKDYIRRLEAGKAEITEDALRKLCGYFSVKELYFIGEEGFVSAKDEQTRPMAAVARAARPGERGKDEPPSGRDGEPSSGSASGAISRGAKARRVKGEDSLDFTGFSFFRDEAPEPSSSRPAGADDPPSLKLQDSARARGGAPEEPESRDLADISPFAAGGADVDAGDVMDRAPPAALRPSRPPPAAPAPAPASASVAPAAPRAAAQGPVRPTAQGPAAAPSAPANVGGPRIAPPSAAAPAVERGPGGREVLDHVLALVDILARKGFFSRAEFDEALARVRRG